MYIVFRHPTLHRPRVGPLMVEVAQMVNAEEVTVEAAQVKAIKD
jgi:hypothetical protein